jgi:hypothetical protein
MEEQKKNLSCKYLGCIYVEKPGGMDILRPAIENLSTTVPENQWISVDVKISPTSIIVCSEDVCSIFSLIKVIESNIGIKRTIN